MAKEQWELDLETSKANIRKYYDEIKSILVSEGFEKPEIQFGWEVEFTKTIFDEESAKKRLLELAATGIDKEDKTDSYLQPYARHSNLDAAFDQRQKDAKGKYKVGSQMRVHVDAEPAAFEGYAYEKSVSKMPSGYNIENPSRPTAYSQSEVVTDPRTPIGSAKLLNKLPEILVKEAKEFGIDRVDLLSRLGDFVEANGIHSNITIWGKNSDGKKVNLLQDVNMNPNRDHENISVPSELALTIANARNEFMKDGLLVFAPAKGSYKRYENPIAGPQKGGFGKRKEKALMPSAMFRGADRISYRPDDEKGKPDSGPFRIEERIISPEALGHPNKTANPEQQTLVYELVEAQMRILLDGVKEFERRQVYKNSGKEVESLSEDKLMTYVPLIPDSKVDAKENFVHSHKMKEVFGDRMTRMLERYSKLEQLIKQDYSPSAHVKGAHVDRINRTKEKLTIAIITDDHSVKSDQYLEKAIRDQGHNIVVIDQKTMDIEVNKGMRSVKIDGKRLNLSKIDAVISQTWGRDDEKAFAIQEIMEKVGIYPLNPVEKIRSSASKIESQIAFEDNDIATPNTKIFKAQIGYEAQKNDIREFLEEIGMPYVVKADFGTQGKQVVITKDINEAMEAAKGFLDSNNGIVVQEAIKSLADRGQDLRVFVIDGKVVGAMQRTASVPGEFRSNTSLGGEDEFIPKEKLSKEQILIAEKCSEVFGFGMMGVDLIGAKNKPVVLEVNDAPQLDYFIEKYKLPVHDMIIDGVKKATNNHQLQTNFGIS